MRLKLRNIWFIVSIVMVINLPTYAEAIYEGNIRYDSVMDKDRYRLGKEFNTYAEVTDLFSYSGFSQFPWYAKFAGYLQAINYSINPQTGKSYDTSYPIDNYEKAEQYWLKKHHAIDFLSEQGNDLVGTYGGRLKGTLVNIEPYNTDGSSYNSVASIIETYIAPGEEKNFIFDAGIRGGCDEGTGFILVIYNDTDLIYYTSSYNGWDYPCPEHGFEPDPNRVVFRMKKPGKVTIVTSSGDHYFDRISIRENQTVPFQLEITKNDTKDLGDNTINIPTYKITSIRDEKGKGAFMYEDMANIFYPTINGQWASYIKEVSEYKKEVYSTSESNSAIKVGDKYYVDFEVRTSEMLKGLYSQLLYYGDPIYNYRFEVPVTVGRPVLERVLNLLGDLKIKGDNMVVISDDGLRKYDDNAENRALLSELNKLVKDNNINVYWIGEYSNDMFSGLMEHK